MNSQVTSVAYHHEPVAEADSSHRPIASTQNADMSDHNVDTHAVSEDFRDGPRILSPNRLGYSAGALAWTALLLAALSLLG